MPIGRGKYRYYCRTCLRNYVQERGAECETCIDRGMKPGSFAKVYEKYADVLPEDLKAAAHKASARWGETDPSCDDVMAQELGERWHEDNPGLASYLVNYCTGIEGLDDE